MGEIKKLMTKISDIQRQLHDARNKRNKTSNPHIKNKWNSEIARLKRKLSQLRNIRNTL